jgi:hypothetical protein
LKLGIEAMKAAAGDHAKAVEALAEYEKQLPAKQAEWEASLGKPVEWHVLEPSELKSAEGAALTLQADNSILVSGKLTKDTYIITAPVELQAITGLRLEALTDASLPANGPGRAPNGNFVIHEFQAAISPKNEPPKSLPVRLQNAAADFSQNNFPIAAAIDGNETTGWAVSPQLGKPHEATFETKEDAGHTGSSHLTVTISQQFQDNKHLLGKFRLSVTDGTRPIGGAKLPEAVAAALAVPKDQRTAEQAAALDAHYRTLDADLTALTAQVKSAGDQMKNARVLGIQDLAWALINNPAFLFNR